jgi:hypothetical protein
MTSAHEAEVGSDHAVKVDTDLLRCPRCRCHLRLALVLDQPTDYPPAQKTITPWTAPVPDTAQTIIEKGRPLNTVTLEVTERLAILNAVKEAAYNKLLAAQNAWHRQDHAVPQAQKICC